MSIPMKMPAEFLADVIEGQVVRYGCILKNTIDGRIVGHLKEVGKTASFLSTLPINPLAVGTSALAQVGQWLDTHQQLAKIRHTLNTLQLIGTVGAVASVAGLGVSVIGFAMVIRRLGRLEEKLNESIQRLDEQLKKVLQHQNMLQMAELQKAWQQLDGSFHTQQHGRTLQLLVDADSNFLRYRNFYASLIEDIRPMENPTLSVPQVAELYGRFLACSLAELEANFYMEDLKQWRYRHAIIMRQLKQMFAVDYKEAFRKRTERAGLLTDSERNALKDQVVGIKQFCQESYARLDTCEAEVWWVEKHGIRPTKYKKDLEAAPDEGIVLIPHA